MLAAAWAWFEFGCVSAARAQTGAKALKWTIKQGKSAWNHSPFTRLKKEKKVPSAQK